MYLQGLVPFHGGISVYCMDSSYFDFTLMISVTVQNRIKYMMKKLTTWAYMQLINKTGISKSTKLKRQSSLLSHSKNCNSKPAAPCRHGHQSIVFETMHSANPAPLVDGRNGNSLFLVFVHMNCLLNCSTSSQQRERVLA